MKDPLFLYEFIEEERASALRWYNMSLIDADYKAESEDLYDLARDIVIELGYLNYSPTIFISSFMRQVTIDLYLHADDTVKKGVNDIIDICDLILLNTDFLMDIDRSKQDGSHYKIIYGNSDTEQRIIKLNINISTSNKCKATITQRMTEEVSYSCDEA
jgi:hypothetical protein